MHRVIIRDRGNDTIYICIELPILYSIRISQDSSWANLVLQRTLGGGGYRTMKEARKTSSYVKLQPLGTLFKVNQFPTVTYFLIYSCFMSWRLF